jgi:hypothetical protein
LTYTQQAGNKVIGEHSGDEFVIKKPLDFFSLKGRFSGHIPGADG